MTKCAFCGKNVGFLPFKCRYCWKDFCAEHRMPENHDCSQDLALGKIKDEVIKKVFDKEDLPDFSSENEELIKGTKVAEETISFEGTFSGSCSLKVIKDHLYEIRYSLDRSYFNEFAILIADGKHSLKGTSPVSKKGKFTYKALSTGMIYIHAMYKASLNDFPRISVETEVFDLSTEDLVLDHEIPITLEEKQILTELETHLKEKIPILNSKGDESFGMILKNGHIKHLVLRNKGLKEIPLSIWDLQYLKTLNLSSNLIEYLPDIAKWNDSLHELNLSHNKSLSSLPENLGNLKSLKILNLSHCESLSTVPLTLKKLSRLTTIDISYCNFHIFPDLGTYKGIIELISLKLIDFRGNHISLEEREKIQQWAADEVLIEPILFFIEKRSKKVEESTVDILEKIAKTNNNEYNRAAALFIILNKYLKREITLIKDIINSEQSALILITLYKVFKKLNNKISDDLRKEIIKRYSEIYDINEEEVQFFIDLEAELIETRILVEIEIGKKVIVGHFKESILYGSDSLRYKKIPEDWGNSDEFKFYNFWVDNGNIILLEIPGVRFLNKILPESIGFLKDLRYLDFRGTNASSLPQSFENIKKIEKLFVDKSFNFNDMNEKIKKTIVNSISRNFSNLGVSSEEAKALACFEIIFNSIIKIDKDDTVTQGFVLNDKNQVIVLSIYADIYEEEFFSINIPDEIALFENLEELRIIGYLSEIPASIGNLKKLKKLDLSNNEIKNIPNSLNSLKNLEELILNSNHLKIIPNEFKYLQNLKRVEINYNKLNLVPNFILNLKNLEILDLSNNRIEEIPNEIINLESLKSVDLSLNLIQHLPDTIEQFLRTRETLKL
ncbi:MAG: AN1-type zinc finger domain-containing protein [Promethearchaeota archaeon]